MERVNEAGRLRQAAEGFKVSEFQGFKVNRRALTLKL
jgi:hypothetical protein